MPDTRPSHVSTIIDDTAAAEVPVLSCTMSVLLLVYAVMDSLSHPASQAVWRALTSATPGVLLLAIFAASVRQRISPALGAWVTAGGILAVGAASSSPSSTPAAPPTFVCC